MKISAKLWMGIVVLAVLSPLGILVPAYFKASGAWGEGSAGPSFWKAPMPDYTFKGWEGKGLGHSSLAYMISALLGIVAVAVVVWLLGKALAKKGDR